MCKALPALYEEPHCPPALLPLIFCDSSFLLCFLPQLGKKPLLVHIPVKSLRKFLVGQRHSWAPLPALHRWVKALLRAGSCCCLPIFCCQNLSCNQSWVPTILRLAQMNPEEYEAVSTFFSSSLMNTSWLHHPTVSIPPYGRTLRSLQGNSCASIFPCELLGVSGLWKRFSWCVCSGSWLCTWCKHTWAAADPELAACRPSPHELAQPGPWRRAQLPSPSSSPGWWGSVGVARCTLHTCVVFFVAAQTNCCGYRLAIFLALQGCLIPKAFLWRFWGLHASGSFFFPPHHRCTCKLNLSGFPAFLLYHYLGFFSKLETILLRAYAC